MTSLRFARVASAFEFLVALGAWVLGACVWWLAGAVMTSTLILFLLTWGREEPEPLSCQLFGCTHAGDPLYGSCDRCGGRP